MAIDIKKELHSTLNKSFPLFSMVNKWAAEFKCQTSSFDDGHSGHPTTATTEETLVSNSFVLNNGRFKVHKDIERSQ